MDTTNLNEQRKLMGLAPRYDYQVNEAMGDSPHVDDTPHPDSPEDDQDLAATPPPDTQEPPDTTGAGPSKHWDMYRKMEESAMKLAKENAEMFKQLSAVTEDAGLTREQRKFLKNAQQAVKTAWTAQKEAYRRISEFGSTMLG